MGMTNYPNGVSSFGVPMFAGLPAVPYGKVLFVQSSHSLASNNHNGENKDKPMASIDAAIGRCLANAGDIIIVGPGHVETLVAAGGLALDVAGVSIFGVGRGSMRPTVNYTTAVGASAVVSAANCEIWNLLFTGNIDALTGPLSVDAADFRLMFPEYRDVTGQALRFVTTTANADRMWIEGLVYRGDVAAGGASGVRIIGGANSTVIPYFMDGNFATSCISNETTAATNLRIMGSAAYPAYLRNRNAVDVIIQCLATTTGQQGPFINARLADDAANVTEAFVGADMNFYQPINIANADGEASMETNITATTDA
ncbi:MAG: hypothetical protein AB7Q01_14060 [Gammaproteobacteria bacterium]